MRYFVIISLMILAPAFSFAQVDFLTEAEFLQENPGYTASHYKTFVEALNRSSPDSDLRKSAQKITEKYRAKNRPEPIPGDTIPVPNIPINDEAQSVGEAEPSEAGEVEFNDDATKSKTVTSRKRLKGNANNRLLGKKDVVVIEEPVEEENIFDRRSTRKDYSRVKRKNKTIQESNRLKTNEYFGPRSAEEKRPPSSSYIKKEHKTRILGKD